MTDGEVKSFFESFNGQWNSYDILRRERASILEDMASISAIDYTKTPVSGGGKSTDTSLLLERIEKRIQDITEAINRLVDAKLEALYMISLCDSGVQKGILVDYYIRRLPWSEISGKYSYAKNQPLRIRDAAIHTIAQRYLPPEKRRQKMVTNGD